MSRVVVIGGGITGLSASLFSKLKNPKSSVTLIEATGRLGGWIKSAQYDDNSVHELGPRTFRTQSPTVNYLLNVIDEIKLNGKIISVSKHNKEFQKRYIYAHKELNLLDFSLFKSVQKPFTDTFLTKLINAISKRHHHGKHFEDLSLDKFIRTRFDDEIADYVINPIIRGIYACDSKDISTQSTFPMLVEMEKLGSNIIFGALLHKLRGICKFSEDPKVKLSESMSHLKNQSSVISVKGGLEMIIKALHSRLKELNVNIFTNYEISSIKKNGSNGFVLESSNQSVECDHVIIATPSYVTCDLLENLIPLQCRTLNNIVWNDVAVVCVEVESRDIPFPGFGHLIPSWEIADTLGVIYDSSILPENDCRTRTTTRYTVMFGGAWFYPSIAQLNNDQLIDRALQVLRSQVGVQGRLYRASVAVNKKCIPVYDLQHKKIISDVRRSIADQNLQIRLCGNSYDGVGVSDCVYSAHQAVQSVSI